MKTTKLKEILGNEELTLEDKVAQIMALNGQDVNAAKESSSSRVEELETEVATLKAKNSELETNVSKYKDYDDLAKFKADTLAEKENNQKKSYLESLGFKRPDLFFDKVDWSKAKYDEGKKTYTGIDVDGLKKTYADLYNEPSQGKITFGTVGSGNQEKPNTNATMNNFIRGIN